MKEIVVVLVNFYRISTGRRWEDLSLRFSIATIHWFIAIIYWVIHWGFHRNYPLNIHYNYSLQLFTIIFCILSILQILIFTPPIFCHNDLPYKDIAELQKTRNRRKSYREIREFCLLQLSSTSTTIHLAIIFYNFILQ